MCYLAGNAIRVGYANKQTNKHFITGTYPRPPPRSFARLRPIYTRTRGHALTRLTSRSGCTTAHSLRRAPAVHSVWFERLLRCRHTRHQGRGIMCTAVPGGGQGPFLGDIGSLSSTRVAGSVRHYCPRVPRRAPPGHVPVRRRGISLEQGALLFTPLHAPGHVPVRPRGTSLECAMPCAHLVPTPRRPQRDRGTRGPALRSEKPVIRRSRRVWCVTV